MTANAIFIAATGQHVGKTTVCLGVIAALKKRFSSVGFIKPVGQQHLKSECGINVDKDAYLFKKHFHMDSAWKDMSPVIIPSGFTRSYLDGEVSEDTLLDSIIDAYRTISSNHAFTIVEGTGHIGVGSIINLCNARVAAALGLDMIIIASGGLGSSYDELSLNLAMCRQFGVNVRGIILNRVLADKRDMILEYFPKTLTKWNVPLIGCVPYDPFLSKPTANDFELLFDTTLLTGLQHRYRHFKTVRLFAGSVETFRSEMKPNELIITPASRDDIILNFLEKHLESAQKDGTDFRGGMILTGRDAPHPETLEQIKLADIPILYAPMNSYDAMEKITSFVAKIRLEDIVKIERAIQLVEEHVNFDVLSQCGLALNTESAHGTISTR